MLRVRIRLVAGTAVAILAAVACGGGAGQAAQPGTYHAGANLCLTGAAGDLGNQMRNGMQLAVDNLNTDSKSIQLAVDYADSAANPQQGVTVFNDLVENKHDPVVFTCGTSVIQATLPLAERNKVLMLNTSAGGPDLIGKSEWLFNDFLNTRQEARVMADYLWNTLKAKGVAINYRTDSYGSQTLDAFKEYWTKLGGNITDSVSHDLNAPNQQTQVARIKAVSSTTDAIYVMSAGRDAGVFIKEARAAGLNQTIVGLAGVVSNAVIDVAGSAAEGLVYTNAVYNLGSTDPVTTQFNKSYKARYADTQPNTFFTSYYEGVLIWHQLVEYVRSKNLEYNSTNLRQAILSKKTFTGLGGAQVTFESDGSAKVPAEIGKVVGGKFTQIQLVGTGK